VAEGSLHREHLQDWNKFSVISPCPGAKQREDVLLLAEAREIFACVFGVPIIL